jgi:polar amino acid transport system substrate-binding protein
MLRLMSFFAFLAFFACAAIAAELSPDARADLAPSGRLRIGINTGNVLLTRKDPASGAPRGIAFDLARELGRRAGLPIDIISFDSAGKLAEAVKTGAWDVAFLGVEPERAEVISFTAPYVEIDSGYLVPASSPLQTIADVDRDDIRIAVSAKSAYDLYLSRSLKHARLERVPAGETVPGVDAAFDLFVAADLDALAGLKPVLQIYTEKFPHYRILSGRISSVRQAIGTPKGREAGAKYLREFVEDIKASGFVATTLENNGAHGLSVAPAAALQ